MLDMANVYKAFSSHLRRHGVLWQSLVEARIENPAILEAYLGRLKPAAEFSQGTFIYVPKGVTCPLPLQARGESFYAVDYRFVVVVEEGGQLELVTGCVQTGLAASNPNGISEFFLHSGARLKYFSIKNYPSQSRYVQLAEGAQVEWLDIGYEADVLAPIVSTQGKSFFNYKTYRYAEVPADVMEQLPPEFAVEIYRETENSKYS